MPKISVGNLTTSLGKSFYTAKTRDFKSGEYFPHTSQVLEGKNFNNIFSEQQDRSRNTNTLPVILNS